MLSKKCSRGHRLVIGLLSLVGSAAVAIAMPPSQPVEGPMLLCFKYSTFQLAEHERVSDFSGSAESMAITIDGPSGNFQIAESEIFLDEPERRGPAVFEQDGTSVYRVKGERLYGIYGLTSNSPDEAELVIWLSGDALRGNGEDRSIYRRFEVRNPEDAQCGQRFIYGWEYFLND